MKNKWRCVKNDPPWREQWGLCICKGDASPVYGLVKCDTNNQFQCEIKTGQLSGSPTHWYPAIGPDAFGRMDEEKTDLSAPLYKFYYFVRKHTRMYVYEKLWTPKGFRGWLRDNHPSERTWFHFEETLDGDIDQLVLNQHNDLVRLISSGRAYDVECPNSFSFWLESVYYDWKQEEWKLLDNQKKVNENLAHISKTDTLEEMQEWVKQFTNISSCRRYDERDRILQLRKRARSVHRLALKSTTKRNVYYNSLGCAGFELVEHLESQFYPCSETGREMTWDNWALDGWHVDHIKPLCAFDNLGDVKQFKEACHYTNLQPLWARENLSKNGKWDK